MTKAPLLTLLALLCSGCTVGPRYCAPPDLVIPSEWHAPIPQEAVYDNKENFSWWEALNDPTLNSLLTRACDQNIDLSIAGMRILQARLLQKGQEGERYPHIDASVMGGDLFCSKDILKSGLFGKSGGHKRNLGFFEAGFDATWEVDLFGYRTHQIDAAQARAEAAEASMEEVWVSLSAEIARHYVELRGYQQRHSLLLKHIALLRENIELVQDLLSTGIADTIEELQTREQLSRLLAEKPLLNLSIDRSIHRLSVLLGCPPRELFCELQSCEQLPSLPCEKPVALPSELLRRRPDIRRAERELAAATEEVGTAVAALFPRFSLLGFAGEIGTRFSSLKSGDATTLFGAPQLLFPILNSKLLQQDVKFNRIQACQATLNYKKTVLNSFEEVENAMAAFHSEEERQRHLKEARDLSYEAYQLNDEQYQKGLKGYLNLLSSSRSLLSAEDARLQSEVTLLLNYIALYKALGGGWSLIP